MLDAEDENFRITATSKAVPDIFGEVKAAAATSTTDVTVDDAEVQVYELKLPYEVGASMEFMEGYGGSPSAGGTGSVAAEGPSLRTTS